MKKVINITGEKVEIIKKKAKKETNAFVYLDPPYYPVKGKNGKININKLYNGDFTPTDLLKLKLRCDGLTREKIPFVLSNSNCEFVRLLFRNYNLVNISEPRGMKQGKGKGSRPPEKCLIITNFENKKDLIGAIKC